MRLRECVRLLVSTVLFCVRGAARSLNTLGFPSAPSLRERLRQLPLTRRTHHHTVRCALRQTTGCVNSDRWASRVERSSLCSGEHTRCPRTPRLFVAEAAGARASAPLSPRVSRALRSAACIIASSALIKGDHRAALSHLYHSARRSTSGITAPGLSS